MNILPKKRWHVKNKDNAARVEADEARFRKKQKDDSIRSLIATQEARVDYLRRKSHPEGSSDTTTISTQETLRLFADVEENRTLFATNKEYEEEKRNEKETHEKKLGILKYLSESVDGTPAVKPWWFVAPNRGKKIEGNKCNLMLDEVDLKRKQKSDPLFHMKKVEEEFARIREAKQAKEAKERAAAAQIVSSCSSLFPNDIKAPGLKRPHAAIEKYEAESKSEKRKRLEKLRADRLSRERSERERAAVLLCKSMGLSASSVEAEETPILDERQLPFNSAFNPELSSLAAERRNAHRERRTSK